VHQRIGGQSPGALMRRSIGGLTSNALLRRSAGGLTPNALLCESEFILGWMLLMLLVLRQFEVGGRCFLCGLL
jgi:hypothetical protein